MSASILYVRMRAIYSPCIDGPACSLEIYAGMGGGYYQIKRSLLKGALFFGLIAVSTGRGVGMYITSGTTSLFTGHPWNRTYREVCGCYREVHGLYREVRGCYREVALQ